MKLKDLKPGIGYVAEVPGFFVSVLRVTPYEGGSVGLRSSRGMVYACLDKKHAKNSLGDLEFKVDLQWADSEKERLLKKAEEIRATINYIEENTK